MCIIKLCVRGRLLSRQSMVGLWSSCGRALLVLLVLCTPPGGALPPRPLTHHRLQLLLLHHHQREGAAHHPAPTTTTTATTHSHPSSSTGLTAASLDLLARLTPPGGRAGGRRGPPREYSPRYTERWDARRLATQRDTGRRVADGPKRKRQGFFGIDNPDFVLRTLDLKSGSRTSSPTPLSSPARPPADDDSSMVARVALLNVQRMRNRPRHRQRMRPKTDRQRMRTPIMSVDTSIEDLRRLMEKNGR